MAYEKKGIGRKVAVFSGQSGTERSQIDVKGLNRSGTEGTVTWRRTGNCGDFQVGRGFAICRPLVAGAYSDCSIVGSAD